jgi:hypothetical protein
MIYTALYVMCLMRGDPLLGHMGGGWALELSTSLGPKWHPPNGSMPFHKAQKSRVGSLFKTFPIYSI